MKRLWAIADLHLGFSTGKWMDRFGDHWKDHHLRVASSWRERIVPGDIVLLPGDFSWAMKPAQVAEEFAWLAELPGQKVLIKGNHDYWWPGSHKKMRELLPDGTIALKKTAAIVDSVPLIGVRGGDLVPFGKKTQEDVDRELEREVKEFQASIDHLETLKAEAEPTRPLVALFHYPPFAPGERDSIFTEMIEAAGCRAVVYGHLHTREDRETYFQGDHHDITYHLVACDALGFEPKLIDEWDA